MFWTHETIVSSAIKRSSLNGSGVTTIARRRVGLPGKALSALAMILVSVVERIGCHITITRMLTSSNS